LWQTQDYPRIRGITKGIDRSWLGQYNTGNVGRHCNTGRRLNLTEIEQGKEMMATQVEKLLLRPAEVFTAIQVSRAKGYAMLASGELPSIRIGRSVRVPASDLHAWVEQQKAAQSEN
jgi:excisionase family DNA binding protein